MSVLVIIVLRSDREVIQFETTVGTATDITHANRRVWYVVHVRGLEYEEAEEGARLVRRVLHFG